MTAFNKIFEVFTGRLLYSIRLLNSTQNYFVSNENLILAPEIVIVTALAIFFAWLATLEILIAVLLAILRVSLSTYGIIPFPETTCREIKALSGRRILAKLNCNININKLAAVIIAEERNFPYIEGYYTGFLIIFIV
jgi:hypothetical protein